MKKEQIESEIKLRIAPTSKESLQEHLNSCNTLSTHFLGTNRLVNTYYDTPEGYLYGNNIAIRIRQKGSFSELTLKTKISCETSGIMQRREWNIKHEDDPLTFSCFQKIPTIPVLVKDLLKKDKLRESFKNEFFRSNWLIIHGETKVILSLDQGFFRKNNIRMEISEIELELDSGNHEELLNISYLVADNLNCWLSFRSKLQSGMEIFRATDLNPDDDLIIPVELSDKLSFLSRYLDCSPGPAWDLASNILNSFACPEAKQFAGHINKHRTIPSGLGRWMLYQKI